MTSHVGRLYAVALALFVFFLTWTTVAAHPWSAAPSADPRAAALAARQSRLRHESVVVARTVRRRWAVYRRQLHRRQQQIAAVNRANAAAARQAQLAATASAPTVSASAPSVSVVTLPPVTITRTS